MAQLGNPKEVANKLCTILGYVCESYITRVKSQNAQIYNIDLLLIMDYEKACSGRFDLAFAIDACKTLGNAIFVETATLDLQPDHKEYHMKLGLVTTDLELTLKEIDKLYKQKGTERLYEEVESMISEQDEV